MKDQQIQMILYQEVMNDEGVVRLDSFFKPAFNEIMVLYVCFFI
jgi:hypothetical protein